MSLTIEPNHAREDWDSYMAAHEAQAPPTADTTASATATSWAPVDLGPYLRGEIRPAEPTLGVTRSDGLRFVYPGKEHAVIGEMESGKSWLLAACCAVEIHHDNRVVYVHFEEADPTDTIGRLRALGVTDHALLERFTFVGPDEPSQPDAVARLLNPVPTLVVLDGVNEAMATHRLAIREEDGAAAYRRLLVKPCTAQGAAVVSADHVVKDKERRGRDPLGSIHKGNGLTGAMLLLENAEPFGRKMRGRSHLYITKDRPGWLRRHGKPVPRIPGKTFMGELVVDDTPWRTDPDIFTIWAPRDDDSASTDQDATQDDLDDDQVLAVVTKITSGGKEANSTSIRAATSGIGNTRVDAALARLAIDDRILESQGKRGARIFTVPEPQPTSNGKQP